MALGVCVATSHVALLAQSQAKVWRIGYLTNRMLPGRKSAGYLAFIEGMRGLGYIEGRNLVVEVRSAEDRMERHPELARELVGLKIDVFVTTSGQATAAAQKASTSIPIVMVGVGEPISSGFVKSLAQPGVNRPGIPGDSNS